MKNISVKKQMQPVNKEAKDIQKKKPKLNIKRFAAVILAAAFVLYFVYIVIWQQITLSKKNKEIDALKGRIETVSKETEELQKELDNLEDPEYIERIAREKLGLVRPNERVFIDANKSASNVAD